MTILTAVEELEFSQTVGEDPKWYSYSRKQFGSFYLLNIALPYDPGFPLLGTYSRKMRTYSHTKTCRKMFISRFSQMRKTLNAHYLENE